MFTNIVLTKLKIFSKKKNFWTGFWIILRTKKLIPYNRFKQIGDMKPEMNLIQYINSEGDIDYAFQHAYEKHPYFCLQPVITMNNGRVSYESELKSPETYRNARKSCQNGKIRTKLSQKDILVLRTEYPFYIVGVYHGSFHIWTGSIRYLHFCFRTHVIPL